MQGTEPVAACDPGSALPAHWHRTGFMQIFVRAYQGHSEGHSEDRSEDKHADRKAGGIGDLRGLISRLDYLHDLGVRGLWLMPIHPCADADHGYAVTDYRGVNPDYGTLEDFDELLRQAHARGIGVIIDYVINHSAALHPLFQASRSGRDSLHGRRFRDWYVWRDEHPSGWNIYQADPWRRDDTGSYFAAFSRRMPDFNWHHPEVVAWHHDNLRFWLNRGVDGFRFDAVGHLIENGPDAWDCQPQNLGVMADIRALLDGYDNRFMVCEVPADPQGYARAAGSAFAFDLNGTLVDAARGDPAALRRVASYFTDAPHSLSTLLSNHDAFAGRRVADQLNGDPDRCRLAAALLLLLPGTPFIYYGEEIGMTGQHTLPPDPAMRTPMSWTADPVGAGFSRTQPFRALSPNAATHHVAAQLGQPASLHTFYRAMLALRQARPSIARGSYEDPFVDGAVFGFHRRLGAEHTLVVLNLGDSPAALQDAGLAPAARLRSLHPAGAVATALLPPRSVGVFDVVR